MLFFSLERTLESLRGPLEDQPASLQAWWKGTLFSGDSAEAARNDESMREAAETLTEERLGWRDQRLIIVQTWVALLSSHELDRKLILHFTPEDLDHFLTILNTRRLTLACEYNIDEKLNDIYFEEDLMRLKDHRLILAIHEMHILGIFMERCLMAMDADCDCQDYECDESAGCETGAGAAKTSAKQGAATGKSKAKAPAHEEDDDEDDADDELDIPADAGEEFTAVADEEEATSTPDDDHLPFSNGNAAPPDDKPRKRKKPDGKPNKPDDQTPPPHAPEDDRA